MTLVTRLSAFFLAALALVLVGFSASLYLLARAYVGRQVDDRLSAALETLAAATEDDPDGLEWEPDEHHLALGRDAAADQVRWAVHDGGGRVVDRSVNLGAEDLPAGDTAALTPGGATFRVVERGGQPWRVAQRGLRARRPEPSPTRAGASADGPPGHAAGPVRYEALVLTAGLPLAPARAALHALGGTLAGLALLLWSAAALLGRRVCRQALTPVSRMAAAARTMGADDLARRLPLAGTGDELDDLGRTVNGLLDRLQEAFERQRRFTGDASHQLRTPLAAMLGQAEVALRRDRPPEEYRRVLALVHDQAGHLSRIVGALLFLARADAEGELAGLEVLDLARWLPEQGPRWGGHERAADLRLEPPAPGPCLVKAQPVLLGQLLDNLVDNAFRYSAPGTPVRVSLARDRGAAVLAVEDAGRGIAPDDLPHVFEPFYRPAGSRGFGPGGVGLGLAVVRRIARAFGGTVAVESEPGRGSRFTLRLPAVTEAAPAGAEPAAALTPGRTG
jgi:two-component system, OmpR family, sensor kinase